VKPFFSPLEFEHSTEPYLDLPGSTMKKAILSLLVPLALAACGGGDTQSEAMPEMDTTPTAGSVTIVTPMNGVLINGNEISVNLSSTVDILPAGDMTPGTGHHHLYLNADLTPADQPVPTVPGSIIHMGDASATYTFTDVEPGEYRLIAVVADGVHVPLQPWVVDTVRFTVANQ
jgi:hypothetical protein